MTTNYQHYCIKYNLYKYLNLYQQNITKIKISDFLLFRFYMFKQSIIF